MNAIAHYRDFDRTSQTLEDHLLSVAELSSRFASKLDLECAGELIGICHDIGKYSQAFQTYLKSAVGMLNQDADDDYVDPKALKGKIDHSTAGAQIIWSALQTGQLQQIVGQILALCVASHHSGLIDCISGDENKFGSDSFSKRMQKREKDSHQSEARRRLQSSISTRLEQLLADESLIASFRDRIAAIMYHCSDNNDKSVSVQNHLSLMVRFLFSCLIDADRLSSAEFEKPYLKAMRQNRKLPWDELTTRLESHLDSFERRLNIDEIRERISNQCLKRAAARTGIFSLSVPTGGGKTLASLRFALHHAKHNKLDRIFYIVPFTSIIDQNADAVREILHRESDRETVVMEHHSNLTPEKQGWRDKLLTENWDAPIVFTTMVQFLESLFGSGTRGARRMHQLANSVVIFDEVQALPIKCVHLFNNAVNFLGEQCNATAVLCTATQPLLHRVDKSKGSLRLPPENELIPNVQALFNELRRVEVLDRQKPGGWSTEEVSSLAVAESKRSGSCLVVVNTKKSARQLYETTKANKSFHTFHLSTNMCPRHRKRILRVIRHRRNSKRNKPTLCFSTQLIEAGVDVDFGSVIRYCAGLDSIAQAAGRCNRNGRQDQGTVHVVNPADENLGRLKEIQVGIEKTNRVFHDFRESPDDYDNDLIGPKALEWFYENYFHQRANEMSFPVSARELGHDDSLLNLLSLNLQAVGQYQQREKKCPDIYFRQAFMTAAKAFKAIDAPTRGIIVPFGKDGRQLIGELCSDVESNEFFSLLRSAQQFTVNVFSNTLDALTKEQAVRPIREDTDILYLTDKRYYHPEFGLVTEPLGSMEFLDA